MVVIRLQGKECCEEDVGLGQEGSEVDFDVLEEGKVVFDEYICLQE